MAKSKHQDYEIISKQPTAHFLSPEGEILEVVIIGCDFDKYVTMVDCNRREHHYKWGYVYNTYKDAVLAKDYCWGTYYPYTELPDCINPWKLLLSNKNYAKYKKLRRKEELAQTSWYVAVDDEAYYNSKHFCTQKAALNYFGKLDETKVEYAQLGEQNTNLRLLEFEDDQVWVLENDRKINMKGFKNRTLKSRHLGKCDTYKQWRK